MPLVFPGKAAFAQGPVSQETCHHRVQCRTGRSGRAKRLVEPVPHRLHSLFAWMTVIRREYQCRSQNASIAPSVTSRSQALLQAALAVLLGIMIVGFVGFSHVELPTTPP